MYMKTAHWNAVLVAFSAIAVTGTTFAATGTYDGKNDSSSSNSTLSGAEVRTGLAASQPRGALLREGEAEGSWNTRTWNSNRDDVGARGPAGARYTERTSDDVRRELTEHNRSQQQNRVKETYYIN
jgi:hypothetical protein